MDVVRADGRFDVLQEDFSIGLIGDGPGVDAPDRGRSTLFVVEYVRLIAQNHLVSPAAVGQLTDEVGHRSAGHKKPGFLPEPFGRQFLQTSDGGIFAEDIVSDFRRRHCLTHR